MEQQKCAAAGRRRFLLVENFTHPNGPSFDPNSPAIFLKLQFAEH
jgi:hypothetical protein